MKKYCKFILVGFIIFIIGAIGFYVELKSFKETDNLPANFKMNQETFRYSINETDIFRITNNNTNVNVKAYIDNTLDNDIKIIVNYPTLNKIDHDYTVTNYEKNKLIKIDFESSARLDVDGAKDLFILGILGFRDKIMYNYSLLEYPEVRVFVHEKYKENIEFVGSYGKVYKPIR